MPEFLPESLEYISYGKVGPSLEKRKLDFAGPKIPQTHSLSASLEELSEDLMARLESGWEC